MGVPESRAAMEFRMLLIVIVFVISGVGLVVAVRDADKTLPVPSQTPAVAMVWYPACEQVNDPPCVYHADENGQDEWRLAVSVSGRPDVKSVPVTYVATETRHGVTWYRVGVYTTW